ncbi:MAG: S1/P1 nuclease [Alistipes sp.]|nr:S1/P1 nuclease [Alistipes sp.]
MRRAYLLLVALTATLQCFGWGQKGHDAVAYIAECNLEPAVYQRVTKLLGGHSLVYYANWMDNASHTDAYRYTKTWHYANVDEGYTYQTMPRNPKGDVVTAIDGIVAKLKSGRLSEAEQSLQLKFLIHLVGDIHAPMHAGRLTDLGGNKLYVKYFDRKIKLHELWDVDLIEDCHRWSYTEWQQQLDKHCPAERKAQIAQGTPADWLAESHALAKDIYIASPKRAKLSYYYLNYYTPRIEERILAGGLRLAAILNEIYAF